MPRRGEINLTQRILLALTTAISAAAGIATLVSLPIHADRFSLTLGAEIYLWTTLRTGSTPRRKPRGRWSL